MTTANLDLYDRTVTHAADLRIHEEKVQTELGRIVRRHEKRIRKLGALDPTEKAVTKELTRFKKEVLSFQKGALEEVAEIEITFASNNLNEAVGDVYKVKSAKRAGIISRLTRTGVRGNKNLPPQVDSILSQQQSRVSKFLKDNPTATSSLRQAGFTHSAAQTRGQLALRHKLRTRRH